VHLRYGLDGDGMTEEEIRADEREQCAKLLEQYAQDYVNKWESLLPRQADEHKAEGWRILVCAAKVRDRLTDTSSGVTP
jgi:threonine synthase